MEEINYLYLSLYNPHSERELQEAYAFFLSSSLPPTAPLHPPTNTAKMAPLIYLSLTVSFLCVYKPGGGGGAAAKKGDTVQYCILTSKIVHSEHVF